MDRQHQLFVTTAGTTSIAVQQQYLATAPSNHYNQQQQGHNQYSTATSSSSHFSTTSPSSSSSSCVPTTPMMLSTSQYHHPTTPTTNATALYYYNVDQYILRELIRPATPKHGNLCRPRLVQPIAIRPQQLATSSNMGSSTTSSFESPDRTTITTTIEDERMEGARNPEPSYHNGDTSSRVGTIVKATTAAAAATPLSTSSSISSTINHTGTVDIMMIDEEFGNDNDVATGTTKNGTLKMKNHATKRKSRDDEDILYYKKSVASNNNNNKNKNSRSTRSCDSSMMTTTAAASQNDDQHPSMMMMESGMMTIMMMSRNSNSSSSTSGSDGINNHHHHAINGVPTTVVAPVTTMTMTHTQENDVPYVTPNPVQYYSASSSSSSSNLTSLPAQPRDQDHAVLPSIYTDMNTHCSNYYEPQYIVYKNNPSFVNSNGKTSIDGDDDIHSGSISNSWTTTGIGQSLPSIPNSTSATTTYTIVKPKAMRPMDVIQQYGTTLLQQHYYENHHYDIDYSHSYHSHEDISLSSSTSSHKHYHHGMYKQHKKTKKGSRHFVPDMEPNDSPPIYDADDDTHGTRTPSRSSSVGMQVCG